MPRFQISHAAIHFFKFQMLQSETVLSLLMSLPSSISSEIDKTSNIFLIESMSGGTRHWPHECEVVEVPRLQISATVHFFQVTDTSVWYLVAVSSLLMSLPPSISSEVDETSNAFLIRGMSGGAGHWPHECEVVDCSFPLCKGIWWCGSRVGH